MNKLLSVGQVERPIDIDHLESFRDKEQSGLRALIDIVPAAIYVCDATGRITSFNQRAALLWGHEPALNGGAERFCGSYRMYQLDGSPLPHEECPMAEVLRTGISVRDREVVLERPDGSTQVALVNIEAIKDDSGAVIGAINCFFDISARKRVEHEQVRARRKVERLTAQLTHERDQARAIMDALPAAVYVTDRRGRITYYNEAAAVLWGCRPELYRSEFCGSWKLYWPDGTPMRHEECPMARALKERSAIRGEQAIAERPDGTRVPFIPFPTPMFDAHGNLTGAVNMLMDISDRQRFEEVQQRLGAIVESSDDAIVSKNLDGIILTWNRGAERIFGYTADEIIGRPVTLLIPKDRHDEEDTILGRLRRGDYISHYETVRRRKDGALIDVSLSISPLYDSAGRIVGASKIARDITEQKKAQARQELLNRELQHRTKNLLAVVRTVVSRSFDGKRNVTAAKAAVLSRLQSLSQTHDILAENEWEGASLSEIVRVETRPYSERVDIDGPPLRLSARAAQDFALALHELATNAAKYGALSTSVGRVEVCWTVSDAGAKKRLSLKWQELNGPPVARPRKKGFGTAILVQVMSAHTALPPVLDYSALGLHYEVDCPLDRISQIEPVAA